MAGKDFTLNSGGLRIRVEGLTKTVRALEKAGTDAGEMRDLMHAIGMTVVQDARSRVPAESGALKRTIRAGRGKTKAVVRAGTKAVPYGGVIHYGWRQHGIQEQPFLKNALIAQRGTVLNQLDDGISALLKNAGL